MPVIRMRWENVKAYNHLQTNDYYQIGIVSSNCGIMYRLLVLDQNIWNYLCESNVNY